MNTYALERVRVKVHLARAELRLRKRRISDTDSTYAARAVQADRLAAYRQAGQFPQNTHQAQMVPVFTDAQGTRCAVNHLLHVDGQGDVASRIEVPDRFVRVHDIPQPVASDVSDWAATHSMDVDDLAAIQPSYRVEGSQHLPLVFHLLNGLAVLTMTAVSYAAARAIWPLTRTMSVPAASLWRTVATAGLFAAAPLALLVAFQPSQYVSWMPADAILEEQYLSKNVAYVLFALTVSMMLVVAVRLLQRRNDLGLDSGATAKAFGLLTATFVTFVALPLVTFVQEMRGGRFFTVPDRMELLNQPDVLWLIASIVTLMLFLFSIVMGGTAIARAVRTSEQPDSVTAFPRSVLVQAAVVSLVVTAAAVGLSIVRIGAFVP